MNSRIGQCQNCNQQSEIRIDGDGRRVCEICQLGGTPLAHRNGIGEPEPTRSPNRRQQLLDHIVTYATPTFIQTLTDRSVEEYRRLLTDGQGWIEVLEREQNERKLLRMASELGYRLTQVNQPRKSAAKLTRRPKHDKKNHTHATPEDAQA